MCRNLRVQRTLLEWRQEGNSYMTVIPLDIIGLILPYFTPDIWKEKFILKEQWTVTVSSRDSWGTGYFQAKLLDEPEITKHSCADNPYFWPDLQGGVWYITSKYNHSSFDIAYYDPWLNMTLERRSFPNYLSYQPQLGWFGWNFVITENRECYIVERSMSCVTHPNYRMVKYSSCGEDLFSHSLPGDIKQLDYVNGQLYLLLTDGRRYQVDHSASGSPSFTLVERPSPLWSQLDTFLISDQQLICRLAVDQVLFDFPLEFQVDRFTLLPSGEFFLIVRTGNLNLYNEYRLFSLS